MRARRQTDEGTSGEAVQAQLERILSSRCFAASQRLRDFLRFTVERAVTGETKDVKEYSIAVDVFEREESFDPRTDPIVRVQAAKLRSKLEKYYATEGQNDPVLIECPKGGYVPVFTSRKPIPVPLERHNAIPLRFLLFVTFALAIVSVAVWWFTSRLPSQTPAVQPFNSIAVLPFVNLSGDKEQDYFCDGMTEELISRLAKVEGLRVVARTSVSEFKGKAEDIRKIGRQFNVQAVLEGSVRRSGDRLRITAQLNNVNDGYHLWSEVYDRKVTDTFEIQEEISNAIANKLAVNPSSDHRDLSTKRSTENPEAYDLYLKGRYQLGSRIPGRLEIAIGYLKKALALDPRYAPAYAKLAEGYMLLNQRSGMPRAEASAKAKEAALKALEIDAGLADGHASLAVVLWRYDWDWEGADREMKRALELDPGDIQKHIAYSQYLMTVGRRDDALRESQRAEELDPLASDARSQVGNILVRLERFDEAIAQLQNAISIDPVYFPSYQFLGTAFEGKKMYPEAREALEKAIALSNREDLQTLADYGHMLAESGSRTEARRIIDEILRTSTQSSHMPIALIHAGLGEKEEFFSFLNRALSERNFQLPRIVMDYRYRTFSSDLRFVAIIKQLRLP